MIRELLARYPRLYLEPLPAYAPHLNPVEFIWSYLKYGRLANFVPKHLGQLDKTLQAHLERNQTPAKPPQIPLARLGTTLSKYGLYLTEDQ